MKVFTKKQANIIEISDLEPPAITEITNTGYFIYKVTYFVDAAKALNNKTITVKILGTNKLSVRNSLNLFKNNNPDLIISNILQKNSKSKDKARSQVENIFFSYNSDITSVIPNDKTHIFATNPSRLANQTETKTIKVERQFALQNSGDFLNKNIVMPVLETNITQNILKSEAEQSSALTKKVYDKMILSKTTEPASVSGTRINTIQNGKKVSSGIVSSVAKVLKTESLNEQQKNALFGTYTNTINPSTNLDLLNSDFIGTMVKTPVSSLKVTEFLEIPIGLISQNDFYFVFQLINDEKIIVQELTTNVAHSRLVANLKIPSIPPIVETMQSGIFGKNTISVKQMDPYASGISLYRKEIKTEVPAADSSFTLVTKVNTRFGDDFVRIEDIVNNTNSIIYRAIPFSDDGILAGEFSSKITKGIPRKRRLEQTKNFVSLSANVSIGFINLEVRNVPAGVCLVTIYKKDLTFKKEKTIVGKPIIVNNQENSAPLLINDSDVKSGRIYEYECEMLYLQGSRRIGTTKVTIKYQPIISNIMNTTISTPNIVKTNTGIFDVSFTISSTPVMSDFDQIKKTLENQGLISMFQENIFREKEKLQNILAWRVIRTNLTTGETEDFGTIIDRNFSDSKFGPGIGVSALKENCEYKYTIYTFLRNTETTMPELSRTVSGSLNTNYLLYPNRWYHPIVLTQGTLTNQETLKKNHAESMFSFGNVGDISEVSISLLDVLPSISNAKVQKLQEFSTLINWKIQGTATKIDHFIITMEVLGMKTIVGKCHNITESNYFQFIDKLENTNFGKIKYGIVPVFYDFSKGTEVFTNEITI